MPHGQPSGLAVEHHLDSISGRSFCWGAIQSSDPSVFGVLPVPFRRLFPPLLEMFNDFHVLLQRNFTAMILARITNEF